MIKLTKETYIIIKLSLKQLDNSIGATYWNGKKEIHITTSRISRALNFLESLLEINDEK